MASVHRFHLLVAMTLLLIGVTARGPPRVVSQVTQRQIARVGETVRLSCPVEADPQPLIEWNKDGESINRGWERFKVMSMSLRITNAMTEDTGKYECLATNGFGQVSVDYILIVLNANDSIPPTDTFDSDTVEEDQPRFTEPHKMLPTNIMRPAGSSIRFHCRAQGWPMPIIRWYKNDKYIDVASMQARRNTGDRKFISYDDYDTLEDWNDEFEIGPDIWTLRLAALTEDDSGVYKCVVSNDHGEISHSYTLTVMEESLSKPILIPPYPKNVTVQFGESASFMCEVRSSDTPHIQWLKRIDDSIASSSTIKMNGMSFVVLPGGEVLSRQDGTFLNKLTVEKVTDRDSGMYICLGANNKGYNIRGAHLVVLPDIRVTETSLFWNNKALPIIIGIPAGVILIIIAITICVIRRKQRVPHPPPPTTVRIPRYTPPGLPYNHSPQEKVFDHQYAALHPQYPADATSQDRIIKTYSDKHSDVSYSTPQQSATPPVPVLSPSSNLVQQHTHMHYYQRT